MLKKITIFVLIATGLIYSQTFEWVDVAPIEFQSNPFFMSMPIDLYSDDQQAYA